MSLIFHAIYTNYIALEPPEIPCLQSNEYLSSLVGILAKGKREEAKGSNAESGLAAIVFPETTPKWLGQRHHMKSSAE